MSPIKKTRAPEGGFTRRDFLKNATLSSFFLMLAQSGLLTAAVLKEIEQAIERGEESWVTSVCQLCPGSCGIRVRKFGSWPVSIAGNPLHPVNRGTLCPKGVAGILSFYDPDRIRQPLKRAGHRGEGKWQEISWEEAIAAVTEPLARLRQKKESHKVGILGGRYRGLMRTLFDKFLEAYGSPNYFDNSFATWQGPVEAIEKSHGLSAEPTYALEKAKILFSFSAPLLEAGRSPVENLRGWATLRRGDPASRGRVVHIGPHLSVTAAKADLWVPIQPGTEGLLALGLAAILLKEGLYDGLYLGSHSSGFNNFKNTILENYPPEKMAELTGVPIDTIIRLAREFASAKPAIAVCGRLEPKDQLAIHTLNALVGSINVPGGVLIPQEADYWVKHQKFQPVVRNAIAQLELLFFYYTNPLFSNPQGDSPQPEKMRETLDKIPLLVSFSPFMDETTAYSDLVLPDHHFLERDQDCPASTMQGFPFVGLSQPVRPPLYKTRHTGDLILQLAKRLGEPVSSALPWDRFQDFLKEGLKNIYDSQRGDLFGTSFESSWTSLLARSGWWSPSYQSLEDFEKGLKEKGGWWDPSYTYEEWGRVFANPEGKFAFATDLPPAVPPKSRDDFPLTLQAYPLMALTGGRNAGQAWLADIAGPHLQIGWKSWAEIHPETAARFGVKDREMIWVESPVGRIKVVAKVYEGVHPRVVAMPFGFGHTAMGRYAAGIGENVRKIQEGDWATAEMPRERITAVKIYRV
ncbi:MAG: molybdopterin-dependent oxidoreductase [Deltaproteobacteria bacterium]|nr:molybdopterin-dependent oxidoreductase [Deltaproteobacteria bacterium]